MDTTITISIKWDPGDIEQKYDGTKCTCTFDREQWQMRTHNEDNDQ